MAESNDDDVFRPPTVEGGASAEPGPPQRGGCLTAYLVLAMIVNPLVGVVYLFFSDAVSEGAPGIKPVAIAPLGVMSLANTWAAIALWRWQRAGLYIFAATTAIALAINLASGLGVTSVTGVIGLAILWALVRPQWQHFK